MAVEGWVKTAILVVVLLVILAIIWFMWRSHQDKLAAEAAATTAANGTTV